MLDNIIGTEKYSSGYKSVFPFGAGVLLREKKIIFNLLDVPPKSKTCSVISKSIPRLFHLFLIVLLKHSCYSLCPIRLP